MPQVKCEPLLSTKYDILFKLCCVSLFLLMFISFYDRSFFFQVWNMI